MRRLVLYILLLVITATEGKTQRLNDAKTQSKDSATLCLCDSASYYESQIRIADSLYKNYLPQSNFEEVKAAMEFFDSLKLSKDNGDGNGDGNNIPLPTPTSASASAIRLQNPILLCAKAHYYHAVSLTEKDDIVGACEHYLTALEIMEEDDVIKRLRDTKTHRRKAKINCNLNKDDYEKVRFIYLIHTRLGELYYEVNFCDISLLNYKKALCYSIISRNDISIARTIKCIGHIFQLSNVADSALYYYNKSQNSSIDDINKLDVEKCIAQILFNKGEKDSAYMLLKKNLHLINDNVKYSYHCTLGNMFYIDKEYDSALYYLEESLEDSIIIKKLAFTTTLSSIYDSLGNYAKKAYYDNLSSKLFFDNINKEVDKSKLQTLYNNYNERKSERISIEAKARSRRITIISCLGAIIAIMFVFVYVRYNYKKQNDRLKGEINDYAKENKRLIDDFKKSNNKKDKIIKQQKKEISEIKNQFNNATGFNLEAYYDSDICKKILSRKDSDFSSLKEDELALLLKSANLYLNNISVRLREQFPALNHNDIYTICLIILNVEKNKLPHLLSRDRKTIWDRLDKIRKLMKIDAKQDLFIHIRDNYLH